MSPSPVVRETTAPRRGAIAPAALQTQSETRSSMGPVGQVGIREYEEGNTKERTKTHRGTDTDTETDTLMASTVRQTQSGTTKSSIGQVGDEEKKRLLTKTY